MRLTAHIPRFSSRGRRVALSLVVACGVAFYAVHGKDATYASVHTTIVLDTPTSIVLDLRQNVNSFGGLENRAILLGDLIATPPVADYVGKAAHIPATAIEVTVPSTPTQALPIVADGKSRKTTDILHYNTQYRLSIEANPTAPTLDIYAEAPTQSAAVAMANATVKGIQKYMASLAAAQTVPGKAQLHITQVGPPEGGIVDPGAPLQLAALAFLFSFIAAYGATALWLRVRRTLLTTSGSRALFRARHSEG
jgi:hypothetical protein